MIVLFNKKWKSMCQVISWDVAWHPIGYAGINDQFILKENDTTYGDLYIKRVICDKIFYVSCAYTKFDKFKNIDEAIKFADERKIDIITVDEMVEIVKDEYTHQNYTLYRVKDTLKI